MFDAVIVGAGPTGLACGIELKRRGLSAVLIDKGCVVNSLYHYPPNMVFFTTPELLEIGDIPMTALNEKPVRAEALKYYRRVADHYGLDIRQYQRVERVTGEDGAFVTQATDRLGCPQQYESRKVILSMGYYDVPNKLNVPGEELLKVIHDFSAKGAAGIIMDVHTGEIIAMVSLPDFDPNKPGDTDASQSPADAKERIFNKVTLGDYEMGSVFKIFNTAMALDSGVTSLTKGYDASHPIQIGRFTIEDYHGKHRWLSVPEIFMYSSNIGSAKMAVDAGADRQRSFLARLGLLQPVPVEIDEVAKPHYPAVWRPVNVMTIAYGHGIAVTPLHVITAVSAIVNGGALHPPTLRKLPSGAVPPGEQVMSPKTSEQMRKLMRLVVEFGTAKMAAAPGYVVGGKTGTAEKNSGGRYLEKKLLSSFIGAFPMHDPRYAILALVDEPHGTKQSFGYATAGWTVAPATSRIIQRIAPILGVAPIDEASPTVTQALTIESLQGKRIESY